MPSLLDSIKRWKLERKGLSSGKKRKQHEEDTLIHNLDESLLMKVSVLTGFLIGMLAIAYQMDQLGFYDSAPSLKVLEVFFLVLALLVVFLLNHNDQFPKTRLLCLIFGGLLLQTFLSCLAIYLVEKNDLHHNYAILVTPFIFIPMIHSVLLGRWLGIFCVVYMSLFTGVLAPFGLGKEFMITAMLSGLTAVYFSRNLKRRNQLLVAGALSGVVGLIIVWSLQIIPIRLDDGSFNSKNAFVESCVILGVSGFCGLLVGGILPAVESLFRITTNMTWLEMSDLNHKLLRKMQLEAPGTFHHSMVVASLSEAAAESIGANAPLCRVASYFHDIGKIEKPEYFIENQGDINPHDSLTPNMSALVIIAHVKDGIDLAVRHNLNQAIINVIKEHHGNSLVYFFYRKALEYKDVAKQEVADGQRKEEDVPDVSEKGFRYPGPCPRTKESGIIALADSIESASRSMKKVNPQKIQTMINELVNNRIKDGQLDQCPLTFRELNIIKAKFASTLRSMLHSRIDYPKEGDSREAKNVKKIKEENTKYNSPRALLIEEE